MVRRVGLRWTLALVAMATSGAAVHASAPPPGDRDGPCALPGADTEAIRAMEARFEADSLAEDWDSMLTYLSPDFVYMLPNRPEIVGHEAMRAFLAAHPRVADYEEYEISFGEIGGCGDLAYVKGDFSTAVRPPESTELVRYRGRWMWILRKSQAGRWIVTHSIVNAAPPIPAEE